MSCQTTTLADSPSQVSSITLELKEGDWILELRLRNHPDPSGMPRWYTMEADQPALLARRDASVCMFVEISLFEILLRLR